VTAEGAKKISQYLTELLDLSMHFNKIEDEGIIAIARGLSKLKKLRVSKFGFRQVIALSGQAVS
jgi:hypothetical protein